MKMVYSFFVIIIVVCFSASCSVLPDTYQFENKGQEIEKIELLYNPQFQEGYVGQKFKLIRELQPDEITIFMDSIYALETKKRTSPPYANFGPYIVCVTYQNGDEEYFASWHIEIVKKGAEPMWAGAYAFKGNSFDELFLEYAGITSFDEDMAERAATTAPSGAGDKP